MIRALTRLFTLALLELALTCLMLTGLLVMVAYRCGRRLITDQPDKLERGGVSAAQLMQLAATFAPLLSRVQSPAPEEELELEPEPEPVDWRRLIV